MPRRGALITVLVLALVAIPALCLGGVLAHACGDGHEDGCAADPCGALMRADKGSELVGPAAMALACDVVAAGCAAAPREGAEGRAPVPRASRAPALPYHRSDVPLRI